MPDTEHQSGENPLQEEGGRDKGFTLSQAAELLFNQKHNKEES
ncbi:MAG: hypothetical protein WCW56_02240 [Candidatus Paceibacterota bacterium]